jgi:hypothetical protein
MGSGYGLGMGLGNGLDNVNGVFAMPQCTLFTVLCIELKFAAFEFSFSLHRFTSRMLRTSPQHS